MKANSENTKQSNKATHRVLAGVLCGASVLSLVLSLVMPPISQAIANDAQAVSTEETVMGGGSSSESTDVDDTTNGDTENQNSDDAEGDETGDGAAEMAPLSDDAETEGAAQPADDGQPVYKVAAIANEGEAQRLQEDSDGYTLLKSDADLSTYLAMEDKPKKLRLDSDISSSTSITISQNTTIDLAGHKLYYPNGNGGSFITVKSGALTIEDFAQVSDVPSVVDSDPGQPATMQWVGDNNRTPQSLTYYVTTSNPKEDGPGTTETTTQHVVSGFGAIVAASEDGSVQQVIYVQDGGTLNLTGGMITTPKNLANNGHIIFAKGENNDTQVNIRGGYITGANLNGQHGGWGGGLCVAGAKATVNMTGGVIAANKAAAGGGIFADRGVTLNLSGGVISGNATYANGIVKCGLDTGGGGYGGGVYTKGADVTIGGSANITNNRVDAYVADSSEYNYGLLGGGGIACTNNGKLTMTGGSVTANYSHEAGGGIYAGFYNGPITLFSMTGGTIAGNESVNAEGGGLRISEGTTGVIGTEPGTSNKVYITNNKTMTGESRGGDWGGGGVFIQKGGKLNIVKTLVTNNGAGGWGGGVGACPTGETIVSHSDGAAIYGNTDNVEQNGDTVTEPHHSAGANGKDLDNNSQYITGDFKKFGHKDFFLVRKDDSTKTVAVVLGKMLGGGSAGWQGTCDRKQVTIDPNGGAEAKYMFGLEAHPTDDAKADAQNAATTVISGNYSYTHGGGIMTNGDLVVGKVDEPLNLYPAIKVKANKVLMKDDVKQDLKNHPYKNHPYQFKLLGAPVGSTNAPFWNGDTLNENGCKATPEVTVNENGEIVIDTAANYQSGNYDLYLVEVPIDEKGTTFDKTIYKIHVEVGTSPVETTDFLGVKINRYAVDKNASTVTVKKERAPDFSKYDFYNWTEDSADNTVSIVTIGNDSSPAFKNELPPYQTSGTWTPQVTKKVNGGEMKKFKFELYTKDASGNETVLDTQCTEKGTSDESPVSFATQTISLGIKDLDSNHQKKLTYYIRECAADAGEGTSHKGYTNDTKIFKVVVTAKDNGNGALTCTPAYYEVDANGAECKTDDPTFTNTYSTSLPLSGMSGVTLTYLAGAAVLCAAAAWMHIRRKANAKGGERRE